MHPLFAKFNFLNKEIIIGTFGLLVVISFILSFILVLILAKKKITMFQILLTTCY